MTKRILIIQLRPGLGDLCMFLPRCHEIALNNNKYEITLLTKKNTKADQLLINDPYIKNIEFIDKDNHKKNFLELFKFFKKNKFEKIYSYQYGPKYLKYIFLSKLCGVKKIFYYGIFKKKEDMVKKSILANEEWLNIKITKFNGKIYTVGNKLKLKKTVVIGLGASGDNKRWPNNYFISLIKKLDKYDIFDFILAAGKNEKKIINYVYEHLPNINFISLENLNIKEAVKQINGSVLFVGNDTGFMHVSACLNIKTFCLYGDTPSNDSIYNENIIPILPPGMKSTYHKDLSMSKITSDYVFDIIKNNLNY